MKAVLPTSSTEPFPSRMPYVSLDSVRTSAAVALVRFLNGVRASKFVDHLHL